MKKTAYKMIFSVTILAIFATTVLASGDTVFSVALEIEPEESIDLQTFETIEGEPSVESPNGLYEAIVYDDNKEKLYSHSFSSGAFLETHGNTTTEPLDLVNTTIRLPYLYEAEEIEIREGNETKTTVDIPQKLCVDDGYCHFYCEGKNIDPDCQQERDESTNPSVLERLSSTLSALLRPIL